MGLALVVLAMGPGSTFGADSGEMAVDGSLSRTARPPEVYHVEAEKAAGQPALIITSGQIRSSSEEEHAAFYADFNGEQLEQLEAARSLSSSSNATAAAAPLLAQEPPQERKRRELVNVGRSPTPRFDPNPGKYWTAVGVALIAGAGDTIVYTMVVANDTINPNGTTYQVPSGTIVHITRTATITAYTLGRNISTSTNSPTIKGTWKVPNRQFGTAYLAPYHNALPGYSGKLVRVQLRTDLLSEVRIHNVLTDFADYYSKRGLAPHKNGMLHVNDLADVQPDLVGFQVRE